MSTSLMVASTEAFTPLSDGSTARIPLLRPVKLEDGIPIEAYGQVGSGGINSLPTKDICTSVVQLSSDSEEERVEVCYHESSSPYIKEAIQASGKLESKFLRDSSPATSNLSRPPLYPTDRQYPSVMQCLKKLASIRGSRNELASIDFQSMEYRKV